MAARIRGHDWGGSPLGPPADWSQPLKTLLGVMLASRQPMFMAWGPARTWFYNDAFIPILGRKHPAALGEPALEVWSEAREDLAPLFDRVFAGHAVHMGDINLMLDRRGRAEETHFAFSYTPAYDESGAVAGLFGACIETTEQVLAERARADEAERQRRLFEQAPSFMCIMRGPDHVFEFVNNAHKQLFQSEDWVGRPVRDAFPDIEGQGYFELLDQVYASGRRYIARAAPVQDRRQRNGPAEVRLLDFIYEPMTDAAGQVTGIFCEGIDVTDSLRTEQALRESEERFREVADAAPVLMWISDTSSGCTWFNKPWLDFTGRRMEQELGHGWADSVHPDDRDRVLASYAEAFERRMPLRRDYRLLRHDGAWRIVDSTGVPRFAGDGRFLGYVGSCADVTDQRAAEQALRRSEEQLRLATDAAEVGLWDVDVVTDTLFWPPRVKAMFGISPDVPVSMADFYAGLHPEDRGATAAAYAAAADPARRALYDVEYRTIGKEDGVIRWVAAKGRGVFEDAGACVRVIGTAIDISPRKAIERQLRELNELLERRVEERTAERDRVWRNSRDLLAVIGADGIFRAANPAWTDILGHDPAHVAGRSFLELVWPDDADMTRAAIAKATERDLTSFENRYRHQDGTPRWISWHTSVEGDLVYAYGRDVTAEKEQREALHAAEEQLRQSQKMEAVGQLTGGLAHDFNNLLTGIAGSLELMATRIAQGRIHELDRYIAAAQGAAKRAAALTHRLLAFSRRQTLAPRPVQANRLVTGMEDLIRRTIGPAVQLEVVGAGGLWTTFADPNQLENSLLNLCINARDAMPHGGRLTIETGNRWLDRRTAREHGLEPGQYISICVSDTGTGMTPDVVARAFDPFFTTKPIGMGTGLGLSMVYGFAKQSGGEVRIYSEPGQGTMVCIYLPRFRGEAEDDVASPGAARAPHAEQGETVLVVDDEPTVRMLITDTLQELGYSAVEAADGAAALRILQSDARIDLLVTDVGLPGGMNGRQVADGGRFLRPGLKVLFITGYAENAVIGDGHLEPGMQVLTKPFAMEDLAGRIKDLIGSR